MDSTESDRATRGALPAHPNNPNNRKGSKARPRDADAVRQRGINAGRADEAALAGLAPASICANEAAMSGGNNSRQFCRFTPRFAENLGKNARAHAREAKRHG